MLLLIIRSLEHDPSPRIPRGQENGSELLQESGYGSQEKLFHLSWHGKRDLGQAEAASHSNISIKEDEKIAKHSLNTQM